MNSCNTEAQNTTKVIYLQNEQIKIGILPDVGGRLVYLSSINGENMLLSDAKLWDEPSVERITPSFESEWKGYNGFITWLGPQSEWWIHQDQNKNLKETASLWPPDPFLIYGDFKVINQSNSSIKIEGPESPVTGVKLIKEFSISGNKVEINVEAINIRDEEVSWELWSNIRVDGWTPFFVPTVSEEDCRMNVNTNPRIDNMKYAIENDYFTFIAEKPSEGKNQRMAKSFLFPEKGHIVALSKGNMLLIEFDALEKNQIHEEQALVEIYNTISNDGSGDLTELEHHGEYRTIKPGKTISLQESWTVVEMGNDATINDCKKYYKENY
ncbi:MAG: DUF4380 domain-containing protein [Prolixibacteraceae bacterium]